MKKEKIEEKEETEIMHWADSIAHEVKSRVDASDILKKVVKKVVKKTTKKKK